MHLKPNYDKKNRSIKISLEYKTKSTLPARAPTTFYQGDARLDSNSAFSETAIQDEFSLLKFPEHQQFTFTKTCRMGN